MAVPAHDDRDFAFAIKYGLPIIPVIDRVDGLSKSFIMPGSMEAGFSKALNDAGISFYARILLAQAMPCSSPYARIRSSRM